MWPISAQQLITSPVYMYLRAAAIIVDINQYYVVQLDNVELGPRSEVVHL